VAKFQVEDFIMKRLLHVPLTTLCLGVLLGSTALITDGFNPSDMKAMAQTSGSDTPSDYKPTDPMQPSTMPPTGPSPTPPDMTSNPDATSQTQVTPPPTGAQTATSFDGRYDFANQTDLFTAGSYSAEELMGLNVQNTNGDTVATISDIVLDRTGAAKEIILSEGGVLGVGSRMVAVPVSAVKPVMKDNAFSHATLEQASLLPLANQKEFRYEAAASVTAPITGDPSMTTPPSTTTTPSTTYDTLAMDEFSADRLIDSEIRNSQGQTLATIEDLLFASDNKAADAVLSVGGFLGVGDKHVALDFQDLQLGQGGPNMSQIVLQIPKEQLEAAPNVSARANGTWGNL
jgi:sporulation protein YlmC with PRC-barrel domain